MILISNKTAVVFGGTGGVGRLVVQQLIADGYSVYATYFRRQPDQPAAGVHYFHCNLTSPSDMQSLVQTFKEQGIHPTLVVNAVARPLVLDAFEDISPATFREDLSVYFLGAVTLMQSLFPLMRHGGAVVHVLSSTVLSPGARLTSYASAKSALATLIAGIGPEYERKNIRILGVSPSYIETDLLKAFPAKLLEIERARHGGSFLSPEEVASVIYAMGVRGVGKGGENIPLRGHDDVARILASAHLT